jgi:hypothetical protein
MSISKTTGRIGIFIVVALLGLISCDLGNNDPQEDVVDEITFIPMISSNEMAKRAGSPPSPYGCVLSTLNPEGSEHLYRYQGFFIKFPPEVHRQARGKTVNRSFHFSFSDVSDRTPKFLEKEGTVRFVNCTIPDSKLATEMLELEFSKFESNSWALDTIQLEKINADETEVFKQQSTTGEWWFECVLTPTGFSIGIYDENDEELYRIYFYDVVCSWVFYEDEGTGGGDTGGGNDPNPPCDNEMDLCFEDPGGGSPVPPPPSDPCESENPPVSCLNPCNTGDPVIDSFETQLMLEDIWKAARVGTMNSASDQAQRLENGLITQPIGGGEHNHMRIPEDLPTVVKNTVIQTNTRLIWAINQDWVDTLPEGTVYTHVHPYYIGEIVYDNFGIPHESGWSKNDLESLKKLGIKTGIVIDADNIVVFDDKGNKIAEHERCGY